MAADAYGIRVFLWRCTLQGRCRSSPFVRVACGLARSPREQTFFSTSHITHTRAAAARSPARARFFYYVVTRKGSLLYPRRLKGTVLAAFPSAIPCLHHRFARGRNPNPADEKKTRPRSRSVPRFYRPPPLNKPLFSCSPCVFHGPWLLCWCTAYGCYQARAVLCPPTRECLACVSPLWPLAQHSRSDAVLSSSTAASLLSSVDPWLCRGWRVPGAALMCNQTSRASWSHKHGTCSEVAEIFIRFEYFVVGSCV